jgi:hypothetical protein
MADKFTQNCYAYFDGGVETLVRGNGFYPCGTVNSTSVRTMREHFSQRPQPLFEALSMKHILTSCM